ncbi:MAG TPA: prolyl oligopeptidase family serine peptidase [Mycobacteriales bacterium]|nr:prolyl oligopeptidase family serine peptidase [Mycobacteriales bacterium]
MLVDFARVRKSLESLGVAPPSWGSPACSDFRLGQGDRTVEFDQGGRWFSVNVTTNDVTELPLAEQALRTRSTPREIRKTFLSPRTPVLEVPDPSGQFLLTERDHELWLRSALDGRYQRLTHDGNDDVRWTSEDALWAPNGQTLAAIRTDNTDVDRLPVLHWLKPLEEVEWVPYAKTGARQAVRSLNFVSITGHVLPVDIGRPGDDVFLLVPVAWLPSSELLFLVSDRINKVLELRAADLRTGASRLVVAERQDSFVYGIRFDAALASATLTPDGHLVWMSERDGWRHAYLYDLDGRQICQLTEGEFEIERVCGFADDVVYLLGRSAAQRPYDLQLCRVGMDGSGFAQLTESPGIHLPLISPSGRVIVDIHSHIDRPPRTDLLNSDGKWITTLATADVSALDELGYFLPEEFTATALDGTTLLHGVLYKPFDFDPSRSYPLVEHIYAGPQGIMNPSGYHGPSTARLLASVGFVACVVDGPGTPGRGKAFQDVVSSRFGQYEVAEHANVIRQLLARHSFLDGTRVGITGGSWGGYNTVRALLLEPETYHVGVAAYPVGDCIDHIGTAIEPYLNLPRDNALAYASASNLPLVDRLRGHLLLMHGTSDVNAPFGATMKLVDAFIRAERAIDLLVLPELDHSLEGQRGRYALERMVGYLAEHLAL